MICLAEELKKITQLELSILTFYNSSLNPYESKLYNPFDQISIFFYKFDPNDYKPESQSKLSRRIINPTRSEVGRTSIVILELVNLKFKKKPKKLGLIQWVGNTNVINCFKNIDNKTKCTFHQFNIVDFYPSLSKDLFKMSLEFVEAYYNISKDEINITLNCRKSFVIHDNEQLIKNLEDNFDVSMRS